MEKLTGDTNPDSAINNLLLLMFIPVGHGGNDAIVIRREIHVYYHVLIVGRRGIYIHYHYHSLCL